MKMKKTIKIATTIIMLSGIILFQSCSKDGAQGAKGDTGAAGAQGPAGPQGPAGTADTSGTNGNSNVHTTIVGVGSANWNWIATEKHLKIDLNCPLINSDVMNYGLVQAYRKNNNQWIALPNTYYPIINSDLTCTFDINFISLGICRIRYYRSDRNEVRPIDQLFKIVTVSGTAKAAHPNTNWNNYEEVEAIINNK